MSVFCSKLFKFKTADAVCKSVVFLLFQKLVKISSTSFWLPVFAESPFFKSTYTYVVT